MIYISMDQAHGLKANSALKVISSCSREENEVLEMDPFTHVASSMFFQFSMKEKQHGSSTLFTFPWKHHDHTGGCIPFMSMCILSNFQNTSHHIPTSWWLRPILGFNPIEASASQAGALSRCSRAASWFLPQVRTTNDWSQIQDQNHCLRTRLPHIQSHAVPAFIKFAMQTRSDCSFYD